MNILEAPEKNTKKKEPTILDVYLKKYKQIIILILGLPCSNKSEISKELNRDLKLNIININKYMIPGKFKKVIVDNNNFNIYEDSDNYNWNKLNDDINKKKSEGIILYGNYINKEKINWNPDFIFFYSVKTELCKKIIIEKKKLNVDKSDNKIKIYFEKIFNPFYENLKKSLKINMFFNVKEDTKFADAYNKIFDLLMILIQKKL